MTQLIRVTDEPELERVEKLHRAHYLFTKVPGILADPTNLRIETQRLLRELKPDMPEPKPVLVAFLDDFLARPLPYNWPAVRDRDDKCQALVEKKKSAFTAAGKPQACGQSARIESELTLNKNGKPQSWLGVYCTEHAAEIAVRKNIRQIPPMPVTEEEFERLHELRGLDPAEIKFMDKHEGAPFFFMNGQLNCPRRVEATGENENGNEAIGMVGPDAGTGSDLGRDNGVGAGIAVEGGVSAEHSTFGGDDPVSDGVA